MLIVRCDLTDTEHTLFDDLENQIGNESSVTKSPAEHFDEDAEKRALDELFSLVRQYRIGKNFGKLVQFVSRFRMYSPFNALLVHIQKPGAVFVATAARWLHEYGRQIKTGAQPLVILRPMGPVMFVFDVSETEGKELPDDIVNPFRILKGKVGKEHEVLISTAKRDGIKVVEAKLGSLKAGHIETVEPGHYLDYIITRRNKNTQQLEQIIIHIPKRYQVILNDNLNKTSQYTTLVHELAHLYCGHLGTPDSRWWPDRRGLPTSTKEFEAESVAYLVCQRLGIDPRSEKYLSGYLIADSEIPAISLQTVMKSAGLIEQMGKRKLQPRKPN